jgi:hypothetical protein
MNHKAWLLTIWHLISLEYTIMDLYIIILYVKNNIYSHHWLKNKIKVDKCI